MSDRARLATRVAAGTALVAVATGLLTGVPLDRAARRLLEQDLGERADAGAEMLAASLGQADLDGAERGDPAAAARLSRRLSDLAEEADVAVASLITGGGLVVATSDPALERGDADPVAAAAGWDLRQVAALDAANVPATVDENGTDTAAAIAPVQGLEPAWFVTVRAPATWSRRMRQLDVGIALAIGAWVLAVAAGGAVVARRLVAPLERLASEVRTVTTGGPGRGLPRTGYVEFDTLAEEFERLETTIATRERWLRALAGTVAHEVRNPAQALRLHLGLLRRELGAAGGARLDTLDAELTLLETTVTSLLAFAEGAPARRQQVSLRELLASAAPGATVVADGVAEVDPVLVARAVGNLARNASAAGATVVRVTAGRTPDGWRIEVADDGRGFEPALVPRAFEPFARGPGDGSGLGLALVQAVAKAHGGSARIVHPGPGGTTIELTLAER